jgi:hypothetical protein
MPDARKKPCCICRRWFRPDPRIGSRQRACRNPDCRSARQKKMQRRWRERNPDYFIARRILDRGKEDRMPEPLRLPPPLNRLPWDIAQSELRVKALISLGLWAHSCCGTRNRSSGRISLIYQGLPTHFPLDRHNPRLRLLENSLPLGTIENEAGVSPTGPPP